jgi:hypothetical protein
MGSSFHGIIMNNGTCHIYIDPYIYIHYWLEKEGDSQFMDYDMRMYGVVSPPHIH